ncbi:SDR family NAD(P)-dependent oxidoreductase [Aestuariicella hydrocarbonica]|uniref:SDR family NAD(P)-dependent oxidoreductase n=1 Tax=Pseudomaricurvus hydrocarbonicus TaxID=1470433 RepID=A0A9E5MMC0_9GAMM|nr:SDR family NAD(P)-dependent oxidoreductase [Aestuariicella hydrocarbonica]
MTQKIIIITGANAGIGFQSTLHFAREGAKVIMACRNLDKATDAKAQIEKEVPNADLHIIRLDVSDLISVQTFAAQFIDQFGALDVLINNAGIVAIPLTRNAAGHEMQLATNYLGAFSLTGLLLPYFRKDIPTRIVNVCSLAHRMGKLNVDNLNWEITDYDQWKAYGNSKVAIMSHTLELNRRLQQSGSKTIAVGAHPGFANTNIHQNSPALNRENASALSKWFHKKMEAFIPSAADAARPIILAAEGSGVRGGDYYGPGGFLEIGGKPATAKINKVAKNTDLAEQLWTASETLTGTRYLPSS